MKKYTPLPFREGNKILKEYEENFIDEVGNKAILSKVDFMDKKNKLNESYTLRVKWIEDEKEFKGKKLEDFISDFYNPDESKFSEYYDGYLIFFFKHDGKDYLSYFWDSNDHFISFMVFELSDKFEIPLNTKKCVFNDYDDSYFECTMKRLVDENLVVKYLNLRINYNSKVAKYTLREGNAAIQSFNNLYSEYCNRKLDYIW